VPQKKVNKETPATVNPLREPFEGNNRKLSLSRSFVVQTKSIIAKAKPKDIATAAEGQNLRLHAKIFTAAPAKSPLTLLPLEKRSIEFDTTREVHVTKKNSCMRFTLIKKVKKQRTN
jgi:hypothetical protein